MKICLIIINYNGARFLRAYLPKIVAGCLQNNIYLLITDDRSTDDSISFARSLNCDCTINTGLNHGFAANVNHGIKYAASLNDFDHFIIANNDVEIGDGLFPAMKKAIEKVVNMDPMSGLIGFEEVFSEQADYFSNFSYSGYDVTAIKRVKEIPGFFFIINRTLIDRIGYMDETYFMYGEDNDYYTRTLRAGYSIYNTFLPVMHYSEGSSADQKRTSWYVYRNALLFAQKNLGISGSIKMFFSLVNQVYNPFNHPKNPGNVRVTRNGFFYNNFLLIKSLAWNLQYFFRSRFKKGK